jgi:hypothetical protein
VTRSAISPDGKYRDVQGGPGVLVTSGANLCQNPQGFWWAPDGRLVFLVAEPYPNGKDSNLWEVKLDPRGPENPKTSRFG